MEISQDEILAKIEDAVYRIEKSGKNLEALQQEALRSIKGVHAILVFFAILVVIGLVPVALGLIVMLLRK